MEPAFDIDGPQQSQKELRIGDARVNLELDAIGPKCFVCNW